jgi:hypothetical protein
LNLADQLDEEGLHGEAAEVRALADEVAKTITDLTADEAQVAAGPTVLLTADGDANLGHIEEGLGSVAAQLRAAGATSEADEVTSIQRQLASELARMEADGVTAADVAELAAFHDELLGLADQLDAEGYSQEAAELRELAGELADEISLLSGEEGEADAVAGDTEGVADETELLEAALAAGRAERSATADYTDSAVTQPIAGETGMSIAQRDTPSRVELTAIPTGRVG